MLVCLENYSKSQSEAPKVTSIIIDGAAIVQMLKPGGVETFEEYAQKVFLPYISKQLEHVTRLDLVWDMYVADTLKATARAKTRKRNAPKSCCFSSHTEQLAKFFAGRLKQDGAIQLSL